MISIDYAWLSGEKDDEDESAKGNPIMVVHCRDAKLTVSRVVLKKGLEPYSINSVSDMILSTGMTELFSKVMEKRR